MDIRAVDLNLLKAFDALMTERAVTRAADRIGLAKLAKMAFDGVSLEPLRQDLTDKLASGTADAGVGLDLSLIGHNLCPSPIREYSLLIDNGCQSGSKEQTRNHCVRPAADQVGHTDLYMPAQLPHQVLPVVEIAHILRVQ